MKRRNKPLSVKITRDGVLTIEIGIETNAYAALHSEYAESLLGLTDRAKGRRPDTRFSISNPRGFAFDVKRELLREAEDGSSLLTKLFDEATRNAIEDGSLHFHDSEESR